MRILMLTDYFYPHVGGVEEAVYSLSRRLVERGHEVRVLTFNTERVSNRETLDGMVVHRSRSIELTNAIKMQSTVSIEALPLAARLIREFQPEIIHAHNLLFTVSVVAAALKPIARRPLVVTMQLGAMDQLTRLARFAVGAWEQSVGRVVLASSDAVIAVSEAVAAHGRRLGCPAERIWVIPNGMDPARFYPSPSRLPIGSRWRVAMVGRLIFNKGPQYLVDAAALILARHPNVEFIMVGDGPLRGSLEDQVARLGIAHAFRFLGVRKDVADILRSCHALVRPSLSEGLPLAVVEAFACGLPVVATPVGGTAEVVRDGDTGFLIRPGSPDSLADALSRLLSNPAMAAEMGLRGRGLVERDYSWDTITDRTLELYARVAHRERVDQHERVERQAPDGARASVAA